MDEKHTWIRRLYEPPESSGEVGTLAPAEQAELEAVRPVKAALDALPRLRPEPQVLDAVVADAMHAPVRHLYHVGEPPALTEAQKAEAVALGEVKEAVESLPARRPDSDVVDAVERDATHPAVRELYAVAAPTSLSARDAAEVKALAPLRDALAAMPRRRPPQATLDAVFAAAVASPARTVAPDRAAERPARRRRAFGWVTGVAGAVLIFASAWWITQEGATPEPLVAEVRTAAPDPLAAQALESGSTEEEASAAEAPTGGATEDATRTPGDVVAQAQPQRAQPQTTQAPEARAGEQQRLTTAPIERVTPIRPAAAGEAIVRAVAAPQDVDDSALRLLYMRLESLHDENLPWDAPAVVLGVDRAPAPSTTHGWMQVRVDR